MAYIKVGAENSTAINLYYKDWGQKRDAQNDSGRAARHRLDLERAEQRGTAGVLQSKQGSGRVGGRGVRIAANPNHSKRRMP